MAQVAQTEVSTWRNRGHFGTDSRSLRTVLEQLLRMIGLAPGTRMWIVAGVTDMRRGFVGLSGMVQTALAENAFSGEVFEFRGKRGHLIKLLWWDGDRLCLFAKRLERGRFTWPQAANGTVSLTPP
jgi:transposase